MRRSFLIVALALLGQGACLLPEVDVRPEADETTCRTCLEDSCAETNTACEDNPACATLVDCVFDCPPDDLGCATTCFNDNPDGQTDVGALIGCRDESCVDDCSSLPI